VGFESFSGIVKFLSTQANSQQRQYYQSTTHWYWLVVFFTWARRLWGPLGQGKVGDNQECQAKKECKKIFFHRKQI